jgi:hypothetical protein
MGYDLTVQGLIRKRAELASDVVRRRAELTDVMAQLQHIDSAIRVFKPEIDLEDLPEPLPAAPYAGFRGEIRRFLLDELRQANAPLSTFDLAERVLVKRGLDPNDRVAVKLIQRRTGYSLAKLRRQNIVCSRGGGRNAPLLWWLSER